MRSRSGRRSRIVRLQKSDRSAGSFSTAHMTASVSLIRTDSTLVSERVLRLVEHDVETTREIDDRRDAPAFLMTLLAHAETLCAELRDRRVEVVACEGDLMRAGVGGMHANLRRRQSKDQPATTRI